MSTPSASAAPRGTPGLTVPSSQNTAPVIKFRCLYTHDLRRKAKRWQDGYLRYHKFNKRAMVFDTSGNFIGDLHWRKDEDIQDGDEMELDKGVLIEVGECMGSTETDISSLFEKKRSSQGSPSQQKPSPAARPSSTPVRSAMSSQPSRSLNDLLGIKRTPIGRLVSPYEERHSQVQTGNSQQSPGPAAKRQKTVSSERPREQRPNPPPPSRAQPVVVDLDGPAAPKLRNGNEKEKTIPTPLGPEERPRERNLNPRPAVIERPAVGTIGKEKEQTSIPKPPEPLTRPRIDPQPSRATPNAPTPSSAPKETRPRPVENTRPSNNLSRSFGSISTNADPPVNTLRMSTDRPRKKLMYSELLRSQSSKSSSDAAPRPQRPSPQLGPERAKSQRVEREHEHVVPDPIPTNMDFVPSESTQFVLDQLTDDPISEQPAPAPQASFPPNHKLEPPTTNPSHLAPRNRISNPEPRLISSPFIKPEHIPPHQTQTRPAQPGPTQPPPIPAVMNLRPQNLTARASHTRLQKSYSDPTALLNATGVTSRRAPPKSPLGMPVNNGPEKGPWTAEALDLFDFWPPGRPKPS
ncbi:hypothetical protein ASPWEDRAFT_64759 [Aspergillus wentii DTO 134E9]|uniref:5'-3' DNA helicase ZGRF1-like N-terminal domain-containing protein n=1 Tax=Aspergillus wentii DTO 134E9 TaxID=1073089 RepID=A0A1L9S2X8_ASPWE|nr:uncharacterized protein ASPWEDRAFT_64759 [Aspergillus wentii DTO 134E9]KAI9929871.1 hypothetical protein MW887_011679 [Aspergillus wentii]OJJ41522.1 hypothetical protein ASPWEDRAFT_64759 [Aspergillus wentii DTO 134E9]